MFFANAFLSPPSQEETQQETTEVETPPEEQREKTQQEINQEIVRGKIEKIKKRLALKDFITQWDEYFRNSQLSEALKNYLIAYRKNPKDEKIIQKLGDTYFEMKKFNAAQKYYNLLRDYPTFEKEKTALTYLYGTDLSGSWATQQLIKNLEELELGEDEQMYYNISLWCISDFEACKEQYEDYRYETLENGDIVSREITNPKILEILSAFENYENFQLEQEYFRDALIIGAFYKNKNYPVSIHLSENLLKEKPNYRPILKILADSYYGLWDYKNAKKYLWEFYELDTSDAGVAYLLGVIHWEEWDQVLSNIYLKKALENGYTPTINIRRQLIYNFFILGSDNDLLNGFNEMVTEEPDLEKSDLELAIYYSILHGEYDRASLWAQKGTQLYPEEENFHWYLWWIYLDKWFNKRARESLNSWLEMNPINPFLVYNMGLLEKQTWNIPWAIVYFKQAKKIAPNSDFSSKADEQIKDISNQK